MTGRFPNNNQFAFTVFDDTDYSTLENVEPVYQFLTELGMRTTKSVWPLPASESARIGGSTLQDTAYLEFVRRLQGQGFEIGLHNVRNHDATREVIEEGFEEFYNLLGQSPRVHCNHDSNRDNIYWGTRRFGIGAVRLGYNLATRYARMNYFQGDVENSPYFWGDICKERITYVRNFVFNEINLERINPTLPYHDPLKPYVNYWFSSSEGGTVTTFCNMLCESNQDQLAEERGICIMYVHFGNGFCERGRLNPKFEGLMRRLAKLHGWFVPVSTLLDYLCSSQKNSDISKKELGRMERLWLLSKFRRGTS